MKGHSWRCFYRIMRQRIRWGCDRGADEMLGVDDDGADDKRWRCEDDEMETLGGADEMLRRCIT